jgi:hypothetical protein
VVFSIQHERRVNPDNTIALDNRILQIEEPLRPFLVSPPGESRGGRRGEQHRKLQAGSCTLRYQSITASGQDPIDRLVAAYLGRELARAEESLLTGKPYVQGRAPGNISPSRQQSGSTCGRGPKEKCS